MNQTIDSYKDSIRQEWDERTAQGWARWRHLIDAPEGGQVVTRKLLELAGIGPGDAVLDTETGYGEPGLSAARLVGPTGRAVCTDISAGMLAVARQRAASEGLDNVELIESDTETLRLEPESFDAVLSRWGLMFMADVVGTLRRLRSFLVRDGRLAVAVWGAPHEVQYATAGRIIREELGLPPPPATGPSMFALADRDKLASVIAEAGFRDIEVGTTTVVLEASSPEELTELMREVSAPIARLVEDQPEEVQERVWQRVSEGWSPFLTPDGRVRTENTSVWAVATK